MGATDSPNWRRLPCRIHWPSVRAFRTAKLPLVVFVMPTLGVTFQLLRNRIGRLIPVSQSNPLPNPEAATRRTVTESLGSGVVSSGIRTCSSRRPVDALSMRRTELVHWNPPIRSGVFIEKLESIKPYIIPAEPRNLCDGEYTQTPADMAKYHQFSMCINCGLCYAACPQYGINKKFTGPAALALAYRYNADNRDSASRERMKIISQDEGVWGCTFVGYCSEVCPKGVDPAAAIQLGKVESAKDYMIAMFKPD